MKVSRGERLAFVFAILGLVMALVVYSRLPDAIPTHFDMQGHADGWYRKPWGPFLIPLLGLGVVAALGLGFRLLHAIAKWRHNAEDARNILRFAWISQVWLALLCLFASITSWVAGMGVKVPIVGIIGSVTGVLFMILGNYMGKIRQNSLFGIRTPWTLANKEVWFRTQRVGGWLFVLAGAVVSVGSLLGAGVHLAAIALLGICAIVVPYSYLVHRRIEHGAAATR